MKYITNQNVWDAFGKDAFSKVRSEIVGTGNAVLTKFSLSQQNLISSSEAIYTGSTQITTGFSINYDDGTITFSSPLASGAVLSADYNYGELSNTFVTDTINRSEAELEAKTGRTYNLNTGSEYLDVELDSDGYSQKIFYLKNYPIVNMVGLSSNEATSVLDTASWDARVEGIGNDYLLETDSGRIEFIDNQPLSGQRRVKADYVWGYSTTPDLVKELAVLLSQRKMVNSGVYKAVVKGNSFTEAQLEEMDNRINQLTELLRRTEINLI